MLRIGVIIPTLQRNELSICVQSLVQQKYSHFLIVVDNERKGSYYCRNKGIFSLKDYVDVLAFTDDDAVVCHNWIDIINDRFTNDEVLGLSGPVIRGNRITEHPFDTCNVAYRASLFNNLIFNEELQYGGDLDFIWRCSNHFNAHHFLFDKNLIVYHSKKNQNLNTVGHLKKNKSLEYLLKKYPNRMNRIITENIFTYKE